METRKSKSLRRASWIIGVVGLLICALLAAGCLLLILGVEALGIAPNSQIGLANGSFAIAPTMMSVWIIAAVAALILIIAILLRVASANAKKKALKAAEEAVKESKVQDLIANAKSKIKIDEETKEKVTCFVKKNSKVIIAVAATFVVTSAIDRMIMRRKIRKIRGR